MTRRLDWLLTAGWAAIILALTSIPGWRLAVRPEVMRADKAGHFVMYLVLGALLFRALRWELRGRRRLFIFLMSVAVVAVFGAFDEWHQQFVNRTMSGWDWTADVLGSIVGAALAGRRKQEALEENDG